MAFVEFVVLVVVVLRCGYLLFVACYSLLVFGCALCVVVYVIVFACVLLFVVCCLLCFSFHV